MTTVQDHAIDADRPNGPVAPAARLVGIGVRDREHDSAALRWAARYSVAGLDTVHFVHAYVPLRLDGCSWAPVARMRDARQLAGGRLVSQAVQQMTSDRPGLSVGGSTIAGLPEDVLTEFSSVVDLLVVGDDSARPAGTHPIARRIQDSARCPVVCVPPGYREHEDRPVTVVVDELGLSPAAMTFAANTAARWNVTLQVSRAWSSLDHEHRPTVGWLTHRQEELDTELADWRALHPQLGIVARIELDNTWLMRVAAGSSLLVTGRGSVATVRATAAGADFGCPTAVVGVCS